MDIKNTVHTLFEEQVKCSPDKIAAIFANQSLTYGELNEKANQLAHFLRESGIKSDTPVALCMERSFDFLICILAILKAGAAYLPIDANHPVERLLFILSDSKSPVLITKAVLKHQFTQYQGTLILLEAAEKEISKREKSNPDPLATSQHLTYVIYTSGSTGTPKGVLIEHQSLINYCQWFAEYCQPHPKIDFSSNPVFDMSVTCTIVSLMLGLTVVICHDEVKKVPQRYLKYLQEHKINSIKLTPSYFKELLHEAKNYYIPLPDIKSIILGGENLSAFECRSWLALYPEHSLFNEYGPTETTVAISTYKITSSNVHALETNVPIGKTGAHMSCCVLDENKRIVPDGEAGELYIGGICLARGYLMQADLTQKQFIKDPFNPDENARLYKTGDLCRKRADGIIEYLGRIDDQIKIRGFRIEPGEVERHVTAHSAIKAAVVLAQKDHLDELRLIAYFIPHDDKTEPDTRQIRLYLQNLVPDYMIPTAFVSVNSFPLSASGKLDKSALPLPMLNNSQNYKRPSTALEKKLSKIWSQELGLQSIGLHDDFFELGGHSLSAGRIISKINSSLGKNISLHDFYQASSIEKLIPKIKNTKKKSKKNRNMIPKWYNNATNTPLCDFQFLLWMANTFESRAKKLNIIAKKRLQGRLNRAALEFAFQAILKKQEVLVYRVLTFYPMQQVQKYQSVNITEVNLESLSEQECDKALEASIIQLAKIYPWPKNSPLIIARLFFLQKDVTELQICMPHIISDDISPEILFSDLSKFYLLYFKQPDINTIKTDTHYKEYVLHEQYNLQTNFDRDIRFWEHYLKDSYLFSFPKEHIVHNMKSKKLAYSTYSQIPEKNLNNLKLFCKKNHISMNDGLCAALALALHNCCVNYQKEEPCIFMNIIKSTRDNPIYDETIGCFLRLEPIKIEMNNNTSLSVLSKQIHQSRMDTSLYQNCSNLVKLTSVKTFIQKRNKIKEIFINLFAPIYSALFHLPPIYRKIFKLYGGRLISFKRNNRFLININVKSNFFSDSNTKEDNLFGLNTVNTNNTSIDLFAMDNIFEACFLCDDSQKNHYLVISANLKPDFRELIAKEVIQIIDSAAL